MGSRLLLADDSITIQKVVAIIFANEEYELTVVDNGVAALEKAREIRPDVMLVDALMPGKTGYEVCAEIRRDPQLCSVPILLLIGAFENPDEQEARSCGADASISKPFESQQLIDKVQEMLELGQFRHRPARSLPLEAAAEELWGDLSSFDTMPPPAAALEPAAPLAAAAPAQMPRSSVDAWQPAAPSWTAPLFSQPAAAVSAAPEPSGARPGFEEEIVEASQEDDLWGAFDLAEEPKAALATSPALADLEAEAEFEAEEFFSFEEESEAIEETGPALELTETAEEAVEELVEEPVVLASDEDLFSFADDLSFNAPANMEPFLLPEYEPLALEPAAEPAPVEPEPAQRAEPAVSAWAEPAAETIPVLEPQSAPLLRTQPSGGAQPEAPALSEADLVAAITKISKEVIERIVWEVVPDLAEALIKEEIRKLKAGIRS